MLTAMFEEVCAGMGPLDLLFIDERGSYMHRSKTGKGWFWRAATAVGLEGLTPHDLRHTAASLAVASGATVKSVQRMLGHASAAMTLDVYAGLFDDDLTDLATRMDAAAQEAAASLVGVLWARPPTTRPRSGKTAGQHGGPRGDRTHNPRIKSPLLCQLS